MLQLFLLVVFLILFGSLAVMRWSAAWQRHKLRRADERRAVAEHPPAQLPPDPAAVGYPVEDLAAAHEIAEACRDAGCSAPLPAAGWPVCDVCGESYPLAAGSPCGRNMTSHSDPWHFCTGTMRVRGGVRINNFVGTPADSPAQTDLHVTREGDISLRVTYPRGRRTTHTGPQ